MNLIMIQCSAAFRFDIYLQGLLGDQGIRNAALAFDLLFEGEAN
jgi:hypothetical protein